MKRHRDISPGPATSAIGHSRSSRPVYREGHHHQTNFVDTKPCRPPLCACPAVSHAADHYQAPAEAMWYQQPQGYWVQPAGPGCQQQLVAWPWLQPSTWHYAPVPPPPPFWNPYSWPAPPPPSSWYYCGHAAASAAAPAPPATFWPPPPTCCMDQPAPLDTSCCCQQCYPSPTTHCFYQPGCMEPQEEWTSKSKHKHKHAAAHQQPRGADGDDDVLVKREVAEDSFFTMLPLQGR